MKNEYPKKEVFSRSATLPFSAALGYGDLVFISGAIGRDPDSGEIAMNDIPAQTRQTLINIQNKLELAGTSLANALKVTIFLMDMGQFANMNEVYRTFFPGDAPARSCIGVASLPDKDALIEIEVIAGR
jgi:2-iminobutanoate/2-iminopropanoate deaminase